MDMAKTVKKYGKVFHKILVTVHYNISKCMYIEMFETYGIRPLCKLFCMTDTTAYRNLEKHVEFIRYSDLFDGDCCHDIIMDKRKKRSLQIHE